MAERTEATGRAVAQRLRQAQRHVACESTTEGFGGEQELEQKAKAAAVRRAGVQAVEACGASQAATLQTGTACEDRDAEADGMIEATTRIRRSRSILGNRHAGSGGRCSFSFARVLVNQVLHFEAVIVANRQEELREALETID